MTEADRYLNNILKREAVNPSLLFSSLIERINTLMKDWANGYLLDVNRSGSVAKGTANKSGTDLDLFISLRPSTTHTLGDIYESLFKFLSEKNFQPKRQNVSINIKENDLSIDLIPAKKQNSSSGDHSLWRHKAKTWTQTNIDKHIDYVRRSGRANEIRILKLWRDQKKLDFPSFYLEMTVIKALDGYNGALNHNIGKILDYLKWSFEDVKVRDPANTNNIISDDLSSSEKRKIKLAAERALSAKNLEDVVR